MDTADKVFATAVMILLLIFAGFVGADINRSAIQKAAIENGHAHYIVSSDRVVTFKWNPPCDKQEKK